MSERTTAGTEQPLDGPRERGDIYDHVLRAVDNNSGPATGPNGHDMPPGAKVATVSGCVVRRQSEDGDRTLSGFRSALRAALDNGDLIEWYDSDGARRLTTTDTASLLDLADRGFPHVDGGRREVLRELAAHHADKSDPNRDLIGAINAALAEVDG